MKAAANAGHPVGAEAGDQRAGEIQIGGEIAGRQNPNQAAGSDGAVKKTPSRSEGHRRRDAEEEANDENFSKSLAKLADYYVNGKDLRRFVAVHNSVTNTLYLLWRSEGILLNHVYTGNAMTGLLGMARAELFAGARVVFLHTGGAPAVFA